MSASEQVESAFWESERLQPEHGSPRQARAARRARTLARRWPDPALEGPVARFRDLGRGLMRLVRERPLGSVAIAVGVGFVVGGALSFRPGRVALAAAARHVVRELLKQML